MWLPLGGAPNGPVNALQTRSVGDSLELYAAGEFSSIGGITASNIAQLIDGQWQTLGPGLNGPVYALLITTEGPAGETTLYAGGAFTHAGTQYVGRVARWDGQGWSGLGGGMDRPVYALAFDGERVIAGGEFEVAGSSAARRLAAWNGVAWEPLDTGIPNSAQSAVYALALHDAGGGPQLYAGGSSQLFGAGQPLAFWNGSGWTPQTAPYLTLSAVRALASLDGPTGPALYVGGEFIAQVNGFTQNLLRWRGGLWESVGSPLGAVHALRRHTDDAGDVLLVAGSFGAILTPTGQVAAPAVARYQLGWSGYASGPVGAGLALASITKPYSGGAAPAFVVGGEFTSGGANPYLSAWGPPAQKPYIVTQPQNFTGPVGSTATLSVLAGGAAPLQYVWLKGDTVLSDGGSISGATTSTLMIANLQPADAGAYRVIVQNPCGSDDSAVAQVNIGRPTVATFLVGGQLSGLTGAVDVAAGNLLLNRPGDELALLTTTQLHLLSPEEDGVAAWQSYAVAAGPAAVEIHPVRIWGAPVVDGDTRPDVLVAQQSGVRYFRNQAEGAFAAGTLIAQSSMRTSFSTHTLSLQTPQANPVPQRVYARMGDGGSPLGVCLPACSPQDDPNYSVPLTIAAADMAIGKLVSPDADIALVRSIESSVVIAPSRGFGFFTENGDNYKNWFFGWDPPGQPMAVGAGPVDLLAADLDGDGWDELLTANAAGSSVSFLQNLGAGSDPNHSQGFAPAVSIDIGASPARLAAFDLGPDAPTAVAVAVPGIGQLVILTASGAGGLQLVDNFDAAAWGLAQVVALATGDWNADGLDDIALLSRAEGDLLILLNNYGGRLLDCDQDGVSDAYAAATGLAPDLNGNGVPDVCDTGCSEDLNGDGLINDQDLGLLLNSFQQSDGGDVNGDGQTDDSDLGLLLNLFNEPCP